jgi:gamma-glutamyl-gamma-aminobutyrate hydrolase PuuD
MMRIAITQRVDTVHGSGERRDCLDQRWARFLEPLGLNLLPVPNSLLDAHSWADRQDIQGVLLSGGNDLAHLPGASQPAPERDAVESALLQLALRRSLPVLGVCRGMQMLNCFLGGSLVRLQRHAGLRHGIREAGRAGLFFGYDDVNSYHDWAVAAEGVAKDLKVLAIAVDDGSVEAVGHRELPWLGIMWHPEREICLNGRDARLIRAHFMG